MSNKKSKKSKKSVSDHKNSISEINLIKFENQKILSEQKIKEIEIE